MPGRNVKLAASAAAEIRASRRLSGRPGLEIGGMKTFRGIINMWPLLTKELCPPFHDGVLGWLSSL
jgi:hypothetical protein